MRKVKVLRIVQADRLVLLDEVVQEDALLVLADDRAGHWVEVRV